MNQSLVNYKNASFTNVLFIPQTNIGRKSMHMHVWMPALNNINLK